MATTASELSESVADAGGFSQAPLITPAPPGASEGREVLEVVCELLFFPRFWGVPGGGTPGQREKLGGLAAGWF